MLMQRVKPSKALELYLEGNPIEVRCPTETGGWYVIPSWYMLRDETTPPGTLFNDHIGIYLTEQFGHSKVSKTLHYFVEVHDYIPFWECLDILRMYEGQEGYFENYTAQELADVLKTIRAIFPTDKTAHAKERILSVLQNKYGFTLHSAIKTLLGDDTWEYLQY